MSAVKEKGRFLEFNEAWHIWPLRVLMPKLQQRKIGNSLRGYWELRQDPSDNNTTPSRSPRCPKYLVPPQELVQFFFRGITV